MPEPISVPPEANTRPLIVAHRGGAGHGPENTLPAFRQAWDLGSDAIEGDFRLTADGQIVCIHDADTQRVAGTRLMVAEASLEALRRLDVGGWYGPSFRDARIPTIAEVFASLPAGRILYVEVKCGPELIPPLLDEIQHAGLDVEQVVVISFHAEVIRALKERAPRYRACWLASCRRDVTGRFRPSSARVLQTLLQCGADGFGAHGRLNDADFVRAIQAGGFDFHAWAVNDPQQALWFRNLGARSLTTDYPERLLDALSRRE